MKVQAHIADTNGDQVTVTTADMTTDDGGPCVIIDHSDGQRLIVSADEMFAAIRRARIDRRCIDEEIPF